MTMYKGIEVDKITYAGQEIPLSEGLNVEEIKGFLNVPASAREVIDPITKSISFETSVGTKGREFMPRDSFFSHEENEECEEDCNEETCECEEVGPKWALPKYNFSEREVKAIEASGVDVTNLEALVEVARSVRSGETEKEYLKEYAAKFANDEIETEVFLSVIRGLGYTL